MKDLEKMLMKKSGKGEMSPEEIEAKMEVLKELLGLAQDEMKGRNKLGMDEMQKVTVAAPDKESLEKGLEKAQSLVEEHMPEKSEEAEEEKEMEESPKEEAKEEMAEEKKEDESMEEESPFMGKKAAKKHWMLD